MIELREGQQQVLAYQGGLMAVSAVPGSVKTFTLTRLAVELVLNGRLDPDAGQQVLIVTYLNSSVDTFKKGIRNRLAELGHEPDAFEGAFDVRTLHSLGLEILRFAGQGDEFGRGVGLDVTDEVRSSYFLAQAIDGWIDLHEAAWETLLPEQI
jgi:DNA helicase-2/ATP-dependent DNA helicase PcrA